MIGSFLSGLFSSAARSPSLTILRSLDLTSRWQANLRVLEYVDTLELTFSEDLYRGALVLLDAKQRSWIAHRELHFYDDGCTTVEPMFEQHMVEEGRARRRIITFYLTEAIKALQELKTSPADQLKWEAELAKFEYQGWYLRYPDDPQFQAAFRRDPVHGHLVLAPNSKENT